MAEEPLVRGDPAGTVAEESVEKLGNSMIRGWNVEAARTRGYGARGRRGREGEPV